MLEVYLGRDSRLLRGLGGVYGGLAKGLRTAPHHLLKFPRWANGPRIRYLPKISPLGFFADRRAVIGLSSSLKTTFWPK